MVHIVTIKTILWRVLGLNIIGLEHLDLAIDKTLDFDFTAFFLTGSFTFSVAGLSVRDPDSGTT